MHFFQKFFKHQYGFRSGYSTFHQLIDMFDVITTSFNDKTLLCYDIIFLDLSSAFDCIRFDTILDNCNDSGIRGNCLAIIESYLYNRKQSQIQEMLFRIQRNH